MEFLRQKRYDPYTRFPNWKNWLTEGLSDRFESFSPDMPAKQNASYPAWKIWFEKLLPYLNDQKVIIVGTSLGSIFITKYLSENTFPKHIEQLHLVGPVFDNEGLVGESVASFAFDTKNLVNIAPQSDKVHIWSSMDDPVVPYNHAERYHKAMEGSVLHTFENR